MGNRRRRRHPRRRLGGLHPGPISGRRPARIGEEEPAWLAGRDGASPSSWRSWRSPRRSRSFRASATAGTSSSPSSPSGRGSSAWWASRGHRRAERLGWGARLVTGVLGLCFLGSLVAGADTAAGAFDYYWYHRISDQGPYESPCGPFGLDTTRLDTRALAAVRTAFPGAQVKIIRGCRLLEDGPDRDVILRVGRLEAPLRATLRGLRPDRPLLPSPGPSAFRPYEGRLSILADLARIDSDPRPAAGTWERPPALRHHPVGAL